MNMPTLCATAFVLASALAIILISRYPQGGWLSLREVLTASPACRFWVLWFVLVFISANGFTKEYRRQSNRPGGLPEAATPRPQQPVVTSDSPAATPSQASLEINVKQKY